MFDAERIRQQFPFLAVENNFVFLDHAASSQKPKSVIDGMKEFYEEHYANIHRSPYDRAERATKMYEDARKKVAKFIGAHSREIIFTKNTTESINLVAKSLADGGFLKKGDRVLVSLMEHHSNIVPWLQLKERIGIEVEFIPLTEEREIDMAGYIKLLEQSPKLVAFTQVSNVLGTHNNVTELTKLAQSAGALVLVDGAQGVARIPTNIQEIGADFYAFSGHKAYGPSGVGVLYGKLDILKSLPPFLGGGGMIHEVFTTHFTPAQVPDKFEAGTPPITESVGLGHAVDAMNSWGIPEMYEHDEKIAAYAYERLSANKKVRIFSHKKALGLISFTCEGMNDYDTGDALAEHGIGVRVGHHCAQPLLDSLKQNTLIRASFGVYTSKEDIDKLAESLERIL